MILSRPIKEPVFSSKREISKKTTVTNFTKQIFINPANKNFLNLKRSTELLHQSTQHLLQVHIVEIPRKTRKVMLYEKEGEICE